MSKLFLIALVLGVGYFYLSVSNPRMLHQLHLSPPTSGGGSLNPIMGGMASGVGAGAVKAAGKIGG